LAFKYGFLHKYGWEEECGLARRQIYPVLLRGSFSASARGPRTSLPSPRAESAHIVTESAVGPRPSPRVSQSWSESIGELEVHASIGFERPITETNETTSWRAERRETKEKKEEKERREKRRKEIFVVQLSNQVRREYRKRSLDRSLDRSDDEIAVAKPDRRSRSYACESATDRCLRSMKARKSREKNVVARRRMQTSLSVLILQTQLYSFFGHLSLTELIFIRTLHSSVI
ncbi:unnamed protein product, partial [Heterotrigona itama]